MNYDLYTYAILIAIVSFMGFVLENAWMAARNKCIDNRNMTLPFLLGYGIFIAILYEMAGTPDTLTLPPWLNAPKIRNARRFIYFLLAFVLVSIGEILLGTLVEHFCGFDYWNYEALPLHITKFTSVPTSCAFAAAITFFMDNCIEPLLSAIRCIPLEQLKPAAVLIMCLMIIDFAKSFYTMHKTRRLNIRWRIELSRRGNRLSIR